jgi:cell division protease FtsH
MKKHGLAITAICLLCLAFFGQELFLPAKPTAGAPAQQHAVQQGGQPPRPGAEDAPAAFQPQFNLTLSYTEFMRLAADGKIAKVVMHGKAADGWTKDQKPFTVVLPADAAPSDTLVKLGVDVAVRSSDDGTGLGLLLLSWVPMLMIVGVSVMMLRQMGAQKNGAGAMGFGRSRARLHAPGDASSVTFSDVAGIEEAKSDLMEVVDFLKDPQKFQRLGGKIPKGLLLVGPPGTGKTLIARAVAGEAGVPFFTISGSDFVEMFVGVGASRVRDMFSEARKKAPCILFIDEIDAMGRHRGAGLGGGNDEREQTLNQMLVEMDGFAPNQGIIIIAATNRPDVLDPALLRPGRFDRQVVVPNPDINGREKILSVHMRGLPLADDVSARVVARGTPGFSGADLSNLCNEAALLAARRGLARVGSAEFEAAKDKIMMGAERKTLAMSDNERRLTAYHEAGHAVCALCLPASDPVHKVTIVPRGRALGMVMRLPEGDRVSMTVEKLEADLTVAMGGRVAEEMVFGAKKVTTGAAADIKAATDIARRMVTEWGLSEALGTVRYSDNEEEIFLGRSVTRNQHMSERTAQLIDDEVRRIVSEALLRAEGILTERRAALDRMAGVLLEHETLTGEEATAVLEDRWVPPARVTEPPPADPEGGGGRAREDKRAEPVSPWSPAWLGRRKAAAAVNP